jgi:hypothetical protein
MSKAKATKPTYFVIPSNRDPNEPGVRDLAGEGNEFATYKDASDAAESLDETCPLEDDLYWCVRFT